VTEEQGDDVIQLLTDLQTQTISNTVLLQDIHDHLDTSALQTTYAVTTTYGSKDFQFSHTSTTGDVAILAVLFVYLFAWILTRAFNAIRGLSL